MKIPAITIAIILATCPLASADPLTSAPAQRGLAEDITGAPSAQMLVNSLRRPPGAKHFFDRSAQQWLAFDQARGYLRGVKDASVDVAWCVPRGLPNNEVDGEIVAHLAKLPPAVRQGNAAPLVKAALRAEFPCPARKEP